jgi:predicted outer membrane protein
METMDAHVAKLETELSQWSARLDALAAAFDVAAAEATLDYHQHVDDLKAKYAEARKKLDELKSAQSSDEWEIVQASVESIWNELQIAFAHLTVSQSNEARSSAVPSSQPRDTSCNFADKMQR